MATEQQPHIAEELLQRAHGPAAATIFHEKVRQRPLLLRPTSPDPGLDARAKRQHERLRQSRSRARQRKSKNKPQPLSAKQKRALGVHEIPKEERKYAIYEPLHELWCGYMREVLGLDAGRTYVDGAGAGPLLASADYHGALITVVRSRCVSRVSLQGIVVKDNKFSFEVITKTDAIKVIPKEQTTFRFEVPFEPPQNGEDKLKDPLVFEIHGSQFETRAPDRATKKFRLHFDPDL